MDNINTKKAFEKLKTEAMNAISKEFIISTVNGIKIFHPGIPGTVEYEFKSYNQWDKTSYVFLTVMYKHY